MKNNLQPPASYEAGKKELESIRQKLEDNQFNMDELELLIERGKYLIEYMTEKLRIIDQKLEDTLKD